jgi:hypothetical protein
VPIGTLTLSQPSFRAECIYKAESLRVSLLSLDNYDDRLLGPYATGHGHVSFEIGSNTNVCVV